MLFSTKLKDLRKEKGLTQTELGKQTGIPRSTIANWEQDRCEPSLQDLATISSFFNVTGNYLIGLDDLETPSDSAKALSFRENELLKFFSVLPDDVKDQVIDYTKYHAEKFSKPREKNKRA